MKIILVNSSPNKNGCTNRALLEMKKVFDQEGVSSEIFWLGNGEIRGCLGCGKCLSTGRCIFNDNVNEFLDKAQTADAFVLWIEYFMVKPVSLLISLLVVLYLLDVVEQPLL